MQPYIYTRDHVHKCEDCTTVISHKLSYSPLHVHPDRVQCNKTLRCEPCFVRAKREKNRPKRWYKIGIVKGTR